ncbi:MAG: TonB-dependent receptor [Balneolaceae bacterium]|nr:TonB-dependent receptor [Balneolaceae bacterium]
MANPDLKWEVNKQIDLGIELGLFNDRISIEADVYRRKSEDMLLERPLPRSSGYATVFENIGSMENRGIELALTTYNVQRSDFSWSTDFNISINENEVLKLHGGSDIETGGGVHGGGAGSIIREGLPVNTFMGYISLGTWNTDEAAEAAQYNRLPGDVKYQDVNNDGAINQDDRVPIGNGVPDGYGSLINTFTYKNFEFTADIQFMYGNDIMWEAVHSTEDRVGIANSSGICA